MSNGRELDSPSIYQVSLAGEFDQQWSNWFEGFVITSVADGETLLTGEVRDQAAFHGLIAKIGNLGIPLISIVRVGETERIYRKSNDSEENQWRKDHECDN